MCTQLQLHTAQICTIMTQFVLTEKHFILNISFTHCLHYSSPLCSLNPYQEWPSNSIAIKIHSKQKCDPFNSELKYKTIKKQHYLLLTWIFIDAQSTSITTVWFVCVKLAATDMSPKYRNHPSSKVIVLMIITFLWWIRTWTLYP